ncbi:hypothetical protein GCM10027277_11420 [Pseudoduganella ginsengisoli]|uniref:Cytochrome b561 bacterial/Ni-hydrogenase domain-containing protein n=1 Tax=Pseudoduganella ginsengisoli TaxID=1462440 RepID=A0A6L6PWC7_9BURK|nr:cytochrome b/b6 domain-containing protein [Pseudoduganella ginsengisoli]MTW01539.1 hypothetical protein [Pseudoduganella ginsengisoli]
MSSKFFARVYAGTPDVQPVRRSLRSVAKAKLRASKAASVAHLAASAAVVARTSGNTARAALPPGQAGAIARSVTDGACGCDEAVAAPAVHRIHVWDLPTRLFHWSLVVAVTVALTTGLVGGDWMPVHGYAGIAIVGLVAFRLVWGIAGAAHARFVNFAPTPSRLRAYLNGRWQGHGHNPLGALSVFALLALLVVQAGTGLVGNDEIAFQGPLATLVDEARSIQLTGLHQQLAYVLLGLIALHVLAIAAYRVLHKTNLVKPMVTGWKDVQAADHHADGASHGASAWRWTALLSAVGVALLAMTFASGAGLAQDAPEAAASPVLQQPVAQQAAAPAVAPAW